LCLKVLQQNLLLQLLLLLQLKQYKVTWSQHLKVVTMNKLYLLGHNKYHAVRRKSTEVSDEHIASIFRAKKPSKGPTRSRQQAGLRLLHARFFLGLFSNPVDGGDETAVDFHGTTRHCHRWLNSSIPNTVNNNNNKIKLSL
jgi:hypothetical protein